MKKSRGFTLMEILLVVICIGILGAVLTGGFRRTIDAARETSAVSRARLLNAARSTYALTVPGAASTWTAAADDGARIQLLIDGGFLDGTSASYLSPATNYTLEVTGAVRDRTVLKHSGSALTYTD